MDQYDIDIKVEEDEKNEEFIIPHDEDEIDLPIIENPTLVRTMCYEIPCMFLKEEKTEHVETNQETISDDTEPILVNWLFYHRLHPYPKVTEKNILSQLTFGSERKLIKWFKSARLSILPEMLKLGKQYIVNFNKSQYKKQVNWNDICNVNSVLTETILMWLNENEYKKNLTGDQIKQLTHDTALTEFSVIEWMTKIGNLLLNDAEECWFNPTPRRYEKHKRVNSNNLLKPIKYVTVNDQNEVKADSACPEINQDDNAFSPEALFASQNRINFRLIGKKKYMPRRKFLILRNWLYEHRFSPYPSVADKEALIKKSGLTSLQITNWFCNARHRILPKMHEKDRQDKGSLSFEIKSTQQPSFMRRYEDTKSQKKPISIDSSSVPSIVSPKMEKNCQLLTKNNQQASIQNEKSASVDTEKQIIIDAMKKTYKNARLEIREDAVENIVIKTSAENQNSERNAKLQAMLSNPQIVIKKLDKYVNQKNKMSLIRLPDCKSEEKKRIVLHAIRSKPIVLLERLKIMQVTQINSVQGSMKYHTNKEDISGVSQKLVNSEVKSHTREITEAQQQIIRKEIQSLQPTYRERSKFLEKWLIENHLNPFPNKAERENLKNTTNLSDAQIDSWFVYARTLLIPKLSKNMNTLKCESIQCNFDIDEVLKKCPAKNE